MNVTVEVLDQLGLGPDEGPVRDLVRAVLDAESCAGAVTVVFVDEPVIVELNGRYREVAEPTDVLAFREADVEGWVETADDQEAVLGAPEDESDLGEVVVCPAVVYRYAVEERMDPRTQMGWTLVHGLLHLVGYDHEVDSGEMRRREQQLLREVEDLVKALPVPRRLEDGP